MAAATTLPNAEQRRADVPELSAPFGDSAPGEALDAVLGPLAHWDSIHYLAIASEGYVQDDPALGRPGLRPAFFPAYPLLVRVVSGWAPSYDAVLVAAVVVALAALFGSMILLYRLTELELGRPAARSALALLAFFPTAVFLGVPYTESLMLLCSLGAVLAARTGRWALAGLLAAACSACRPPGALVLVPLLLLYLYGPRADREAPEAEAQGLRRLLPLYPLRPNVLWLGLALAGPLLFSLWLELSLENWRAWLDAQELPVFNREPTLPPAGLWAGFEAAVEAVANKLSGKSGSTLNVLNMAFVLLALVGGIAMLRVLPVAYGAYTLVSLLPALGAINPEIPLISAPRFVVVMFPLFMWLGYECARRRLTVPVTALFAALLVYYTASYASWAFVA